MSISARTLFDDTKAISLPEKNPDSNNATMATMSGDDIKALSKIMIFSKLWMRHLVLVDGEDGLYALQLVGGEFLVGAVAVSLDDAPLLFHMDE